MKSLCYGVVGAFFLLILSLLYAPTFFSPFLWDDDHFIRDNPSVVHLQSPASYALDPNTLSPLPIYNHSIYRPLRTFFFALQHNVFGLHPFGFHFISFFLHVCIAVLIGRLLFVIGASLGTAMGLAFLWSIHPAHTEVVSFISSQGDLLSAFFLLCATLFSLSSLSPLCRWATFAILITLALLSKETSVAGFAVIGWLLFFVAGRTKDALLAILLGGTLSILYLLARYSILGAMTQLVPTGSLLHNLYSLVPKTLLGYFGLLVFPYPQSALYQDIRFVGFEPWAFALFLAVMWMKDRKHFVIGLFWSVAFLGPICNLVPISIPFAERFVYLASVGLLISLLPLAPRILAKVRCGYGYVFFSFLFMVAIVLGSLTYQRNQLWKDELALFIDSKAKAPNLRIASSNLIAAFYEKNMFSETLAETRYFEQKWPMTEKIALVKLESACKIKQWDRCFWLAENFMDDKTWAPYAQKWQKIAKSELASVIPIDSSSILAIAKRGRSKLTVVHLWATWCKPCVEEMPEIVRLYHQTKSRVEWVMVSGDSNKEVERILSILHRARYDGVAYRKQDSDTQFVQNLAPTWTGAIPAMLGLDTHGKVLFVLEGAPPKALEREMAKHL